MATSEKLAEQLAAEEEHVRELEARREQVRVDRGAAVRRLKAAENQRLALERTRAAGEDVDDDELAAAVEAIEGARELADERVWNARLEGTEEAIEQPQLRRDEFGRRHFAAIAAEEVKLDGPARDALVEAWVLLTEAADAYAIRVRRWHQLGRYGDIDPRSIPVAPVAGDVVDVGMRFERGIEAPTPRTLR